jgi:NADH:ubiquinone oxidoreductase subunit F (NADH-binding)/(2Fe-2S) ferredoxin
MTNGNPKKKKNHERRILICQGTGCISSKSNEIRKKFETEIVKAGIHEKVEVTFTGCHGFCAQGPLVFIKPEETLYCKVKVEDVEKIVESHIKKNEPVEDLFYEDPKTGKKIEKHNEIDFYAKQKRMILENCGHINPEDINEYLHIGGYSGLKKAFSMKPEEVIEAIKESGLRGRGGAGFPTGLKWGFCRNAPGKEKYVICNADEGDPGAFMDRSILEADPHSVLEGMIIGGYAIGASNGIIYVRSEYPLAVHRFRKTVEDAKELNFLGKNVLDSGFDFDVMIQEGAGAFVCGEETALMASIEGERGIPKPRPPFPATSGLWGKPTNINNVKSWAAAAWIFKNGVEEFKKVGVKTSTGTAVFSLTGKVKNSGLIEVPMGTTLREIIFGIGGGILDDKKFKAVQTGGPSGGCLPASKLDLGVDFETLQAEGSIMGSGGMVVADENTCMVDLARYFLAFTQKESCGKCTPCREGTLRALEILERITRGEADLSDLDDLEELCHVIKDTSLCALGQTAPNPILSTLKHFRHEYEEHITDLRCSARVCTELYTFVIDEEKCIKCGLCARICPVEAIMGSKETSFRIDCRLCTHCQMCYNRCPKDAIEKVSGKC